jgi:hypothetical protein
VIVDLDFSMSAGLDASTVTPGKTAPDVSFTTPDIDAWANATAGSKARHRNVTTLLARARFIPASWGNRPDRL